MTVCVYYYNYIFFICFIVVAINLDMPVYTAVEADNVLVICSNITEGCLDREVSIEFTTTADQTATGIARYVNEDANDNIIIIR